MWLKAFITVFLFYFLAVFQNSFFAHFKLLGATPDLVFIFFFLIVFFEKKINYYWVTFFAVMAGILLDAMSYSYFGTSIVLLLILGYIIKKVQESLRETEEKYPVMYFIPIFLISLISYQIILSVFLYIFNMNEIRLFAFGLDNIGKVIYDVIFAYAGYVLFTKFLYGKMNNRQLLLFRK